MVRLSSDIGQQMTGDEARSLLESTGNGVLSLAADDRGYGIPVSYGFDDDENRIVLEFVNSTDSKKQAFAETATEVTLTVYNYEDVNTWESVIVTGTIEPLDEDDVSERFASLFFAQADDAAGDIRWIEMDEVEREWYEIRIANVTGRHSGVLPHRETN